MFPYANLFEKTRIGSCELKNRFAMAPMGPLGLGDAEGGFNQRGIDYYTERAKGGTGLIITGVTFADNEVEEHGMPNCPCATYDPIQFVRTAREMTERIHAYGSKIWLQMSGGFGRVTIPTNLVNLLFLGLGASALCFVTWNFAVKILGALKTSVYIYMVPVITVITSVLILHETITPLSGVGIGCTFVGLLLSEYKGKALSQPKQNMQV